MPRYVEVENLEVSDYVTVWDCNCSEFGKQLVMAIDDLQYLPAADVQKVRHGRWISNDLGGYKWAYYCSACGWVDGYPFNDRHKYCPNCGAKMDSEGVRDGQRKTD